MTIRNTIHITIALAFSTLAFACADDQPGGDAGQDTNDAADTDDTGVTGDGDGDSGDGDGDSGDGDSGDGDSGDGDSGDETGDGETGDGETGDGDTETGDSDGDAAIQEACESSCGVWDACVFPFPECVDLCLDGYKELEGDCLDKTLALSTCQASLNCEEYIAYLESEPGNACEAEEQAQFECDPN